MNIRTLKPNEIECRIGMVNEKGISLLLYKNARVDMQILDECFGVFGWKRTHSCIDGNLYCAIEIRDPDTGEWILKEDVGVSAYTEKEKSKASDAFKRSAVNIGIGRELYTAPFIWIPASKVNIQRRGEKFYCNDHFAVGSISYNDNREISSLNIVRVSGGEVVYRMYLSRKDKPAKSERIISDEMLKQLYYELDRTGVDINTVLNRYGIYNIQEMSEDTYQKAMNSLRKTKDKYNAA